MQLGSIMVMKRGDLLVVLFVLLLGLAVAFYLYHLDKHSLIYYGDAVSHLVAARKLVDWQNPGLVQIGTVWLPLPHFLLLPFSLIDPLFTTGFAGLAISLPCLAITSLFLYRMILRRTNILYISFAGALLYASNPNILYMGITAMTEAPFMMFFVLGAYYFQKWYQDHNGRSRHLLACSILISLATLCRYEGWFLPVFLIVFVFVFVIRKGSDFDTRKKINVILIAALSFSGIVLWLVWNMHLYGDPLEFAHAQFYSAASQALNRTNREHLFLKPINDLSIYGGTALVVYGPALLVTTIFGCFYKRSKGKLYPIFQYVFLSLPPIFTIIALLIGIGEMNYWFNARFSMLLSPLIILLTAMFLSKLSSTVKKNLVLMVIGVVFATQLASLSYGVVTYIDAKGGFEYMQHPYAIQAGEELHSIYDNGTIFILTGSADEHRLMLSSGIPLDHFDEIIDSSTWKSSFKEPWLYDKWVVLGKSPDDDAIIVSKYWTENEQRLDEHYHEVYENKYYKILLSNK